MRKIIQNSLVTLTIVLSQASNAAETTPSQPTTQSCPVAFYSVNLPTNAKQCQLFDADTPASMVFFSPENKDAMIQHFQSMIPTLKVTSTFNDYTLLMGEQDTLRIIVSSDGKGSQVDMLVIENTVIAKNS